MVRELTPAERFTLYGLSRRRFLRGAMYGTAGVILAGCAVTTPSSLTPSASSLGAASEPPSPSPLPSVPPSAAAPSAVRGTYFIEPSSYVLAKAEKWYEKATGTTFDWTEVQASTEVLTLLASNGVDIGFGIGSVNCVRGIGQQIPMSIVALIGDVTGIQDVVARKGISSAADLVGHKVAVQWAGNAHMELLAWLSLHNVDEAKVDVIDLGNDQTFAAWKRGDIDATCIADPARSQIIADGGVVLPAITELRSSGWALYDNIIVETRFLQQYPDAVGNVVAALGHAVDFWNANQAETATILAQQVGLSVEETTKAMASYDLVTTAESAGPNLLGTPGSVGKYASVLQGIGDLMVKFNAIPATASAAAFVSAIDPGPVQYAIQHPFSG